jgi:hypothetical protein
VTPFLKVTDVALYYFTLPRLVSTLNYLPFSFASKLLQTGQCLIMPETVSGKPKMISRRASVCEHSPSPPSGSFSESFKIDFLGALLIASFSIFPVKAFAMPEELIHIRCKEAIDYQGCIKASEPPASVAPRKEKNINKAKDKAKQSFKSQAERCKSSLRKYMDENYWFHLYDIDAACQLASRLFKSGQSNDYNQAVFVAGMARHAAAQNTSKKLGLPFWVRVNQCSVDFALKKLGPTGNFLSAQRYCFHIFKHHMLHGFVSINSEDPLGSAYLMDTVKQVKVRGSIGRYIEFKAISQNPYSGTPDVYVNGSPAQSQCSWGGSGSNYGWRGGWSNSGNCWSTEGTPDRVYKGLPAGIQKKLFYYLLDCKDRTFDRKGDALDAFGIEKKGWLDTTEDLIALEMHSAYCPIINALPASGS